jgi:hypothetical protein
MYVNVLVCVCVQALEAVQCAGLARSHLSSASPSHKASSSPLPASNLHTNNDTNNDTNITK